MIILPKITYPVSTFFKILENHIKKKDFSKFIWAGRKPKIKIDTLQLPKKQGGWNLPNITHYITSMQLELFQYW